MPHTSFKKTKHGMVKPVTVKKEKLKHPDVREIKRIYVAISKLGQHQVLDMLCFAVDWWTEVAKFYNEVDKPTASQARKITRFLEARRFAMQAKADDAKREHYVTAIQAIETISEKNIPKIKKYIALSEKIGKKQKEVVDRFGNRFERITGVLSKMFPSCPLQLVVVPSIIDPVTGKDIGHKLDHSKDTIYYSRVYMQAMRKVWRTKGILAIAIEEAWWLARGMSVSIRGGMHLVDAELQVKNYRKLMEDFEEWARKKDTPARLARKPAKLKQKLDELEEVDLTPLEEGALDLEETELLENDVDLNAEEELLAGKFDDEPVRSTVPEGSHGVDYY